MILDSIVLNNFGIYGGRQVVALAPEDDLRPIILFGGMNGGGKTTFLDAIQLVLYGPKARCAGRGKLGYRDYLREMIHHGTNPEDGTALELSFRRTVDGEMHRYRVTRSWRQTAKEIEERLDVTRDGEFDPLLSEHWDEYIESYIPSGIAHLFFFDAEQIKDLADGEHAAEVLGTSIGALLGLDLVDRLDTDLIALSRRKRAATQSTQETEKTRHAQEEIDRITALVKEAEIAGEKLEQEVASLATKLERLEYKFRQEGGDLYLRRAELETESTRLEGDLAKEEDALRTLAAGPAPFLLIPEVLEKVQNQAKRETEARKSALLVSTLDERDSEVLKLLKLNKVSPPKLKLIERLLEKDRSGRAGTANEPVLLGGEDHLATELHHLRNTALPDIRTNILKRLERVNSLQEDLARCERDRARVPAEDEIAVIQKELERLRPQHQIAKAQLAVHVDKRGLLARDLENAISKFERELGQEVEVQVDREHHSRVLKHSARVRQTLATFRTAIICKHAHRLERLVLESFKHLLHKPTLVTDLKIDPATFRIALTGGNGKPLVLDRLSAGERQLLATSLLWGLAKASGRPLPTIIDTPLGRLDSSHRRHLLDRYFPVASHQVILLSTDEEVNEANLDRLKPHIGRSYTLTFDEQQHRTIIKPGYFWSHESAN